mmetsp:Transcript_16608/g.23573  ORF Transcript_16608/g.23573 Transcript_16608/m.23573 type:complete len:229 (-) Transcript_16608:2587-3273(-)
MSTLSPSTKTEVQDSIVIPYEIQQQIEDDQIDMDHFYCNGNPYLHTKSLKVRYLSTSTCKTRNMTECLNQINTLDKQYKDVGINITTYHADNAFSKLKTHLNHWLNIVACNTHVGRIERSIRIMKERARSIIAATPCNQIPKIMCDKLQQHNTSIENSFIDKQGNLNNHTANNIMTRQGKLDYNHIKLQFVDYCQLTLKTNNTMRPRTIAGIALRPSNETGHYYFMNL